jgi:hypothetical protein
MAEIAYVTDQASETARGFERRFQELPSDAGVIFASVKVHPEPGGGHVRFFVYLGIDRKFEEETGMMLIRSVLAQEIADRNVLISAQVYRGVAGACRGKDPQAVGPAPS